MTEIKTIYLIGVYGPQEDSNDPRARNLHIDPSLQALFKCLDGEDVYLIDPVYHVCDLNSVVRPYGLRMRNMGQAAAKIWRARIWWSLNQLLPESAHVVFFDTGGYRRHVADLIIAHCTTVEFPLGEIPKWIESYQARKRAKKSSTA